MPENKSRFVVLCQQLLALGTVAALAAPAAGVVSLDIVKPAPQDGGAVAAAPAPMALVAADSVAPEVTEVPLRQVATHTERGSGPLARRDGRVAVAGRSAPTEVSGFATVGVTWDGDERLEEGEVAVSVRSREDGRWGPWQEIEYHDDHGPDPDSAEARDARQGTDPIVVGAVDDVQVRVETVDGALPEEAALAVVDPRPTRGRRAAPAIDTAEPTDDDGLALSAATDVGVTPKPEIFSRAQWGADERLRRKDRLSYYEIHAGFVHHTVNANNYTRAQVPALIRGIYAYHVRSRGWSDIGYNFIVDRFGRIWEGRYGGVDRPVVGAHTSGYNERSFAMSALGNFDKAQPSAAMIDAYGRLFAWKLSLHGVAASSPQQWVGKRYFPAINGHRDAGRTACPGAHLYDRLPEIRDLAAAYQAPFTDRARSTDLGGSPWPDVVVRDATTRRVMVVRTGGQTDFQPGLTAATGWGGKDLIAASRDLTGDDIPDVVARDAATGRAAVYPGTSQAGFGWPLPETDRFADLDLLVAALDLTGDGRNDLVGRTAGTTNLWVYPGNGLGGFEQRQLLSSAWSYDLTAAVGDFDGDGRNDLVGRSGRTLYLVPGTGRGLGTPVEIPGAWGQYSHISGAGDLDNDGRPDLLVKKKKPKVVFVVPGNGAGRVGHRLGPFPQFRRMDFVAAVGQMAGDSGTDLVARNGAGTMLVFPNNGARNVESVTDAGFTLEKGNLILNVGDWNGDGYGDVMTRTGGRVDLRLGNGYGGFEAPVVAARRWGKVKLLAAVGDITGDGYPDLMGQPVGMSMRIYPGDGSTGFGESYVAHSAISSDRHTGLGLWDSDGSPDSLLRRPDGTIVVYRGNGPGGLMDPIEVRKNLRRYDIVQSIGDATGDGRPDLLAREARSGKLWMFPGTPKGFGVRRLVTDRFAAYDLTS